MAKVLKTAQATANWIKAQHPRDVKAKQLTVKVLEDGSIAVWYNSSYLLDWDTLFDELNRDLSDNEGFKSFEAVQEYGPIWGIGGANVLDKDPEVSRMVFKPTFYAKY